MTGVSFGFQVGAQGRTEILLFTTEEALARFRASANWQAGVDGSITIVRLGAAKSIDTDNLRVPIMGFIFDNAGLMYDLSLKGNKYLAKILKILTFVTLESFLSLFHQLIVQKRLS